MRRNSIRSLSEAIQCEQAVGAEVIEELIHNLGEGVDPAGDIEDAVKTWRAAQDLVARINCPHCGVPETNARNT